MNDQQAKVAFILLCIVVLLDVVVYIAKQPIK